MKRIIKKYLLETNKVFIILFVLAMCLAAIAIAPKWNKSFNSYWGIAYLVLALLGIRELYRYFFHKKRNKLNN